MSKHEFKEIENVEMAKKLLENGTPMYVFDLETTGLSSETDRILSFSSIKMRKQNGLLKEEDRLDIFIDPGFKIPDAATAINHIDNKRIKGCPREKEASRIIRSFLGENPFICGYNSIWFDLKFIEAMYQRSFREQFVPSMHLDVWRMAEEKLELPSHKLAHVCEHLGKDSGLKFHNSMDDVIATYRSMEILMEMYN